MRNPKQSQRIHNQDRRLAAAASTLKLSSALFSSLSKPLSVASCPLSEYPLYIAETDHNSQSEQRRKSQPLISSIARLSVRFDSSRVVLLFFQRTNPIISDGWRFNHAVKSKQQQEQVQHGSAAPILADFIHLSSLCAGSYFVGR